MQEGMIVNHYVSIIKIELKKISSLSEFLKVAMEEKVVK